MRIRKIAIGIIFMTQAIAALAGNKDRIGQAGGNELLINPWARSSGFGSANTASVTGLEAMRLNVSGLAFTPKTEVGFHSTDWLRGPGTDIRVNSFGLAQRVGEQGVLGLSIMSMNFGDIQVTTVDLPEGGLGTFSPRFLNLGLAYAREFSNSIYGGIVVRTLSESIADAKASGVCFDAGIRYVTMEDDKLKFGISLRNVGPKISFNGDGFSTRVNLDEKEFTVEQRRESYELPSLLHIGASYDVLLGAKIDSLGKSLKSMHRITFAGNFQSNSFGKDQVQFGVEYSFKDIFMIRGGYMYEDGLWDVATRTTAFTGPTAGATIQVPLNKNGSTFDIDYSYRATNPFLGTHSIGVRINL
jgi:hypothetical protein